MIVKLLTEHHLECLILKVGCRGSSESTHVKMQHCWKSHAAAQIYFVWPKKLRCPVGGVNHNNMVKGHDGCMHINK